MKRFFILSGIALGCAAIGWITYLAAAPAPPPLSKYVPAGPLVYLEAEGFLHAPQRLEFFFAEEAMAHQRQLRSLFAFAPLPATEGRRRPVRRRGWTST